MRNLISLLMTFLLTHGGLAQTTEPFSFSKRELIEGAKNEIKILPNFGQEITSVSVSNGSISKGIKTSMVIRNGTTVKTQDSIYFWILCKSSTGVEDLVINSVRDDSLNSCVVHFTVEPGPILGTKVFRNTGKKDVFESTTTKGVTPKNVDGISLTGTSLAYGFSRTIEEFTIEVIRKRKIRMVLRNKGPNITIENRHILESTKADYIQIGSIIAHLDCGIQLRVKAPGPIYY